jgi:hypothetical protein
MKDIAMANLIVDFTRLKQTLACFILDMDMKSVQSQAKQQLKKHPSLIDYM